MLELKPNAKMKKNGFTLIELIVTLAIAGIFASIAIPSFLDMLANDKTTSVANDLLASVQQTRSEAVRYSSNSIICARADDNTCGSSWSKGWVIQSDQNGDGTPEMTTRIRDNIPSGITITSSISGGLNSLTFKALGQTNPSATNTFTITHSNPSASRIICIYAGGQSKIIKSGNC